MTELLLTDQSDPLPPEHRPALVQVGWLGNTGRVYALRDSPARTEPGGFTPLYIQIGVWTCPDSDGRWQIDD